MNDPIRILLVDDSPYFLEAAREFLQIQEPRALIEVASEEQDALAKSMVSAPDIILLDLNLTDISGLALIPLFRKHLPEVKIIILTIMSDDSYRAAALQAGADAFVQKNEMSKKLISTITGLMECRHDAPADKESNP